MVTESPHSVAQLVHLAQDGLERPRENAEKVADGVEDGIDRTSRAASALTRSSSARIERSPGPDASSTVY
jgi:hypothetical protein